MSKYCVASEIFYLPIQQDARYQQVWIDDCHQLSLDDSAWPTMGLAELSEWQTYCLRIPLSINEQQLPSHPVLKVIMLGSVEVHWDGEWLGSNGKVASSRAEEVPGSMDLTLSMSKDQLTAGEHLLSMRVSTHHHSEDLHSIFYAAMLVDQNKVNHITHTNYIFPLLLCGAMILLAIFFQMIYWSYQKDLAFFIFSCLCLSSAILITLELLKYFYAYPWDWHVVRLRVIIATTILAGCLLVFYYLLYYRIRNKRALMFVVVNSMLLIGVFSPSYDLKSLLLFAFALITSTALSIYAIKHQKIGAKLNLILMSIGLLSMLALPFQFAEQWFAAVFSLIAIANLITLTTRFGYEREKSLQSLRLETELLRRNIQPHFLMNSLLLIIEWIETKPKLAVEFIELLAEEFRLLNSMSQQKYVSVDDELVLCRKHFEIMQSRYQHKMQLTIVCDNDELLVPPAIIHTLIENAFSHNSFCDNDEFKINISANQQTAEITVITPFREKTHRGSGTGSDYIKSRLIDCYANRWSYDGKQVEQQWITRISLPSMNRVIN